MQKSSLEKDIHRLRWTVGLFSIAIVIPLVFIAPEAYQKVRRDTVLRNHRRAKEVVALAAQARSEKGFLSRMQHEYQQSFLSSFAAVAIQSNSTRWDLLPPQENRVHTPGWYLALWLQRAGKPYLLDYSEELPIGGQKYSVRVYAHLVPFGGGEALLLLDLFIMFLALSYGLRRIFRLGVYQLESRDQHRKFVAAVSHEFRTPLSTIRLYADMLKAGWLLETDKKEKYLGAIATESERLSHLIENFLYISSKGRSAGVPEKVRLSFGELFDELAQSLHVSLNESEYQLVLRRPCEQDVQLIVHVELVLVKQIFFNLVENAIKHAVPALRNEVELIGEVDGKVLTLSLRDFGPGIPEAEHNEIFEEFYKVEREGRHTGGSGIGLAVVKQICQQIGAQIEVRNELPGARISLRIARSVREALESTQDSQLLNQGNHPVIVG